MKRRGEEGVSGLPGVKHQMVGSEAAGQNSNGMTIEKPQEDYREYLALTLENGLRAIVVSDSKCDKAAAALSIKVGSMSDPKEIQGLAHFLEHMLFLGTEKYPKEEEYKEFMAQHAGSSNAYTAESLTNYHFSISPDNLDVALDRFSQFFIAPLFNESATDRELKNVHSEHSKNLQSDMWRWMQLVRNDANPKHPMNHFGTGNIETLKETPDRDGYHVRQRLIEFYTKYYSANLMCVVVLGKESLSDLEAMVRGHFGAIVNRNVRVPTGLEIGGDEPAFDIRSWPRFVRCLPVKDVRTATFQFLLPQQYPMRWRTKPTSYMSFVLGHEGKGSLLSCLKARGCVTDLMAGPALDEGGASLFEVTVHMTEAGESQVGAIGEWLFSYIRLLQQCPVSEELWRETQSIQEMNFRFRSVMQPMGVVTSLASAMQNDLPVDKVLSGPSKLWELDKAEISEVAGMLTCARLRLVLAMKSFSEEKECPESERWYGTKYGAGALPEEWHKAWERSRLGDAGGGTGAAAESAAQLGLALPMKNPFVAEDLELKPQPAEGVPKYPVKTDASSMGISNSILQVYFRQDDTFNLPKAHLLTTFYSPWVGESAENRTKAWVWATAVAEELNEFSYDAEAAGLSYRLTQTSRGMSVTVGGYQDKIPVLLRAVVEKMLAMTEVSEHTWNIVHTVLLRSLKNAAEKRDPLGQASEWQQRLVWQHAVTAAEKLEIFKTLTRESIQGVSSKIFERCYVEALLQGNLMDPGPVAEAMGTVLRPAASVGGSLPSLCAARLPGTEDSSWPPGGCVLLRRRGTNPEEKNGAVIVTLQAADETLENLLRCQLAEQVLKQRCFDELRTKQNLGYIVHCVSCAHELGGAGSCGLQVMVQSETHPAEVHRRIRVWLSAALVELEKEADDNLEKYLKALLVQYQDRPKNLASEVSRNWSAVSSRSFRFTRRAEAIAFLQRDPAELLSEFRTFVRESLVNAPRIAVEVLAAQHDDAPPPRSQEEAGDENGGGEGDGGGEIVVVLESAGDIEAFRKRVTWRKSPATIET